MNLFSQLSLRNRFMFAPLIGVALTLILYFSSYSIIQIHSNTLEQLSESNLPQISKVSHFVVALSENQNNTTNLLISALDTLNEEQVYLQGKIILNQLHDLDNEFSSIFSQGSEAKTKENITDRIKKNFSNYKKTVVNSIELSTVNVNNAKRELKKASKVRTALNTDLLQLSQHHTKNLATSSELINDSLYDDNYLLMLTIFLITIMILISFLFANHLASSLSLIHSTLLELSNGNTKIDLPEQNDKYLKKISIAVYKFRDSLKRNDTQQEELEQALERIKDNEQRYFGMLKLIPTGVIAIDRSNKILLFNNAAEIIFDCNFDKVLGQPLTRLIPDQDFLNDISSHDNATELHIKLVSITGLTINGEELELEASAAGLQLSKETLTVIAVTDVTQRNKMDKTLRRAQKMDAVGQLCGGISHDFNNILNIILGNLELLDKRLGDDEKIKKYTSTIRKSTQRAADLTGKLLGFSRDQSSEPQATNINSLINDMKGLISRSLTPEVEIHYQLAEKLKETSIDNGDFEDSLINLVLNARDAMPEGGKLTIETNNVVLDQAYCAQHHATTPGEHVELCVSDNGQGISPQQLEHVFEPFYTTKEKGKGTGLGLAMVFGFVSRSGASINIYSEEQIGTTFKIYFPLATKSTAIEESQRDNIDSMPPGNETILVVDDEEGLRSLAQDTLHDLGYSVLTASDAQHAMDMLATKLKIDLLFTDVVMPGRMNGYQLAETAMASNPHLKVLLTSGYTKKALVNNDQEKCTFSVLAKPYSLYSLAEEIRNTLDT